ncbi:hypothetical protein KC887_10425, partial [Candidatus Kaiserbacteria bacterium]|nr:hypothetical protein [Candidatus Kaiserbacteria bacterium]
GNQGTTWIRDTDNQFLLLEKNFPVFKKQIWGDSFEYISERYVGSRNFMPCPLTGPTAPGYRMAIESRENPNAEAVNEHLDEKEDLRLKNLGSEPSLKGKYACDENTQYERALVLTLGLFEDKQSHDLITPPTEKEVNPERTYYCQPRERWQESYRTCGLIPNLLNKHRFCNDLEKKLYGCQISGEGEEQMIYPPDI